MIAAVISDDTSSYFAWQLIKVVCTRLIHSCYRNSHYGKMYSAPLRLYLLQSFVFLSSISLSVLSIYRYCCCVLLSMFVVVVVLIFIFILESTLVYCNFWFFRFIFLPHHYIRVSYSYYTITLADSWWLVTWRWQAWWFLFFRYVTSFKYFILKVFFLYASFFFRVSLLLYLYSLCNFFFTYPFFPIPQSFYYP